MNFEPLIPAEIAEKAEAVGVKKAAMNFSSTFLLAVLAGAFIALGAIFYTTVTTGSSALPFGVAKLLGGMAFSLGLILVVIAGAELFTGNNLIVMAWYSRKISFVRVMRNWIIVYIGNFMGSVLTVILMFFSGQFTFNHGAVGLNALNIAQAKCSLHFVQAIFLGMLCNALVCLAVWLCYSARTGRDKIMSIIFPITAFVAAGFEHSVANMYFVPMGLMIKQLAPAEFWASIGKTTGDFGQMTWANFLVNNLLPVTIGNIIGGSVMVGLVYWVIYIYKGRD